MASVPELDATCLTLRRATVCTCIERMSTLITMPQSSLIGTPQPALSVTGTYANVPGASSPCTNARSGPQKYSRLLLQLREDNL